MRYIKRADWGTVDGLVLEENAIAAVRSQKNFLVVAGPGAGKTELLAQRACYLLQTNTCTFPRKILAISFKRDAAINLKHRVKLRCGDDLSRRFDSFTFDAFAKQLLDRFRSALPGDFNLLNGYNLFFKEMVIHDVYKSIDIDTFNRNDTKMMVDLLTKYRYPMPQDDKFQVLAAKVLDALIKTKPAAIDFRILMRLAELIIRSNPKLQSFLRQTYQYIFLDEFQDTTDVQYDFLKTCFLDGDSDTVMTAVGDDKQRIMTWANARTDIFPTYIKEMNADKTSLQMNFRSAPRLINLQNHLMRELLGSTENVIPSSKWKPDEGEIDFHVFQTLNAEAMYLHQAARQWINGEGINPRDIVFLVKQRVPLYAGQIIDYLNANGINARDESELQDILTEELTLYVINVLYVIYKESSAKEKDDAFTFLSIVSTEFEDTQLQMLNLRFMRFIKGLRKEFPAPEFDEKCITTVVDEIINFAGLDRIKSVFSQYKDRRHTEERIVKLKTYLLNYYKQSGDVISTLDMLMGIDSIPVMTIHKSKGLEFHTVVFIGFEDGAFWSYEKQADEDKRAFFVALSRAKLRVVFSCCRQRKNNRGIIMEQKVEKIRDIFEALRQSGVMKLIQHK